MCKGPAIAKLDAYAKLAGEVLTVTIPLPSDGSPYLDHATSILLLSDLLLHVTYMLCQIASADK